MARVLPNAEYLPRGSKSIRKLATLASSRGHELIMIINGFAGQPRELCFLNAAAGWQWLDARIELREVKLQRDLGSKVRLEDVKVAAGDQAKARDFALFIGRLWGLPIIEEPSAGSIAFVEDDEQLRLQFYSDSRAEPVGPILYIARFG